eukprot:SM000112S24002  [mRNA]  locus=s112:332530:334805:+ [translate_table: standard]
MLRARSKAQPAARDGSDGSGAEARDLVGKAIWAKLGRFPWWPAQVVDGAMADAGLRKEQTSDREVLVRFFGTYDYAWVDAVACISELHVKFADRSKSKKKSFQVGIDEALEFSKTGKLPSRWEGNSSNGLQPGLLTHGGDSEDPTGEHDEGDRVGAISQRSKRKGWMKGAAREQEKVPALNQRQERRQRIMRQLGLSPPAGSPFARTAVT